MTVATGVPVNEKYYGNVSNNLKRNLYLVDRLLRLQIRISLVRKWGHYHSHLEQLSLHLHWPTGVELLDQLQ